MRRTVAEYRGYEIVIECDDKGCYAFVPDLKGCQSQGATVGEATANIREAVDLYLETLGLEG